MADKIAPYINPILHALRRLGGYERRKNIITAVIQDMGLEGSPELEKTLKSGVSVVESHVVRALRYLNMAGYIESPKYRYWELTEKGRASHVLSDEEVSQLLSDVRPARMIDNDPDDPDDGDDTPDEIAHNPALLDAIRSLSPSGFEEFCGLLLRKTGLDQVEVTGGPGDGGIDGTGVLRMNPFVSFKVLFQCKRYTNPVQPSAVREFRGAMDGRIDKGLILTTSTFTDDAVKEASRDGVRPIELVDGDRLVELCESYGVGLKSRTVYAVDVEFFSTFVAPLK